MRSVLESALVRLLNEDTEKAEELFHQFIVERARQIHEKLRQGDDFVLEENWDNEIHSETYFTEEDLADVEDGEGDEAAADDMGDADMGDDMGDAEGEMADAEGDLEDADADMADAADDLEGDLDAEGGEGDVEDRIDDLEDQLERLTAEFEEMMSSMGDEDMGDDGMDSMDDMDDMGGDEMADDMGGDDMGGDDMGDDMADAEDMTDDMDDQPMEGAEEDDFDDITESVLDELEKVSVSLTDGKEIGAHGKTVNKNDGSAIPQKPVSSRDGAKPIQQKVTNHTGFERETPPATKDMKARKNTKKSGTEGQSKVSKEGDKSAELNKLKSDGNNKSVID